MKPIYLDYNATTPLDPAVAEAMRPYLEEHFGNPSSTHWYGVQTKKAVEKARREIAGLLNCHAEEIIFTSGGSEANNYAIKGVAFANRGKGNHIITSSIEHPAVYEVCQYLEKSGFQVTYLPVNEFGLVDLAGLKKAISPQTILITIMHANNEVGTIQPISEIARIAKEDDILLHTDAAQSHDVPGYYEHNSGWSKSGDRFEYIYPQSCTKLYVPGSSPHRSIEMNSYHEVYLTLELIAVNF